MSLNDADLSRVVVIGSSGSGKTTYARRLSTLLEIHHIELDALHWLADWVPRHPDEFRALVDEATLQDRWVADGNYSPVRDLVWRRATTVIWLNYSFPTVMWRGLSRTLKLALTKEELYAGNRERLSQAFFSRDSILWWIVTTYRRRKSQYRAIFDGSDYPGLAMVEFKSTDQSARSYLALRRQEETAPRGRGNSVAG